MVNYLRFQRPSRYIDGEINAVRKDAPLKVALAFPDIYDVGMSHLGLKILYDIINTIPYASAERVFHPWLDLEAAMRAGGVPLASLESGRPLSGFDVVGFSLQYELSYTSVLNMLAMGGIPLRSSERTASHPLVVAGGPSAVNPMPMSPFIDAFLVGDGEEAVGEMLEAAFRWKTEGDGRRESLLKALSAVEGVYVPGVSKGVRRRFIASLENAPYPLKPVVPYAPIVHDRVNIEVSRGCAAGCRFCQAGIIYRPLRERSPERALEIAERSLGSTGYEEVAFTSLSAGDYSGLLPLVRNFNRRLKGKMVSVSLPSLRVKAVNQDILKEIKSVKKTGFTMAPEAATDRLRGVINKDFSMADYDRALWALFSEGWQNLKLYFMIGLPTERDEDIEAIPDMVIKAVKTAKKHTRRFVNISVSASPFVPKPHTPFQWCPQADLEEIKRKKAYLRGRLRKVNFRDHDNQMSMLEAAFARGDERLAPLIEAAYREGARLDGWTEAFDMGLWLRAMERTGIDASFYARRQYPREAPLPWEMVDTGVKKEFLLREYEKAVSGEISPDCRVSCSACGLQCKEEEAVAPEAGPPVGAAPRAPLRKPIRVRCQFSKTGLMRHLSHRELITHVTRAIRRAGVMVEHTKGFHPLPRIAFGPPLGVGIAGMREYFDMDIIPAASLSLLRDKINSELSEGVGLQRIVPVGFEGPSLQEFVCRYEYEIICPDPSPVDRFLKQGEVLVEREKGSVDVRPMVKEALTERTGRVVMRVMDLGERKVRLDELVQAAFGVPVPELSITRLSMSGRDGREPLPAEDRQGWQVAY